MITSYYNPPHNDFTLIQGDCVETLSKFKFGFDMFFADSPYFLSGGGISCQSGKVVCVDKDDWDKPTTTKNVYPLFFDKRVLNNENIFYIW